MRTKELFAFIKERHAIFLSKEVGKSRPWTKDVIFQRYKFCCVYRENDRVTRWIADNWRTPYQSDLNIWFAMVVARLINWPDTLEAITPAVFSDGAVKWNPARFLKIMAERRASDAKMYTGSYMIHASQHYEATYQYQEAEIYTPMWNARKTFLKKPETLREVFEWLKQFECMGDFMAAQVVADIKYCPRYSQDEVSDWWTFAAPGPGSRRGLARVHDLPKDYKWKEPEWPLSLAALQASIDPLVAKAGMPRLHAQDLQNCLCEFDKYQRVLLGEGKPRSLYAGT